MKSNYIKHGSFKKLLSCEEKSANIPVVVSFAGFGDTLRMREVHPKSGTIHNLVR